MAAKPSRPAGMAGTRPTGRPRKIRSRPTSGVGGRPFTERESEALVKIGERYADAFGRDKLLDSLWMAHSSYEAADAASREQVSLAEELRDIEAIQADAARVRVLLATHADAQDPESCVGLAATLSLRMANFPNVIAAETTAMPEGIDFMHAQLRLAQWLVMVRGIWPQYRVQLIADIDLVLSVCDRVPIPAGGTKRFKGARKRFARDVADIYRAQLHPARVALWREVRDERNDPPPPDSGRAFARAVMEALGVPFEVKRGKG